MKKNPPVPAVPRPAPRRVPNSAWLALGLFLLAVHIAFFTWHTDRAAQSFNRSTVPANTIKGVPEPRFFLENDSYAWLAHTRDLMNSGGWRLRHTFMDNAPYGREMHWSHLLIWILRGLAAAIIAATGWPVARAVELAGVWAMPLIEFLFLSMAFLAVSRKAGLLAAAGLVFSFLTYECISISFFPLEPDHHAFQFFFILASFVCLQFGGMGWIRTAGPAPRARSLLPDVPPVPGPAEARRWFIASGVFGGLALWVGATVWLIALAIIALAMIPALPFFHAPRKEETYAPTLWRFWAAAGVLVGLVCYLLEYAPRHFSMRLEVNHPLYWISWIGVALGLEQLARLRRPLAAGRPAISLLLLAGLLALAQPLAVFFGPAAWHQMHDPFLKRLCAKYIVEFLPSVAIREGDWTILLATFRLFSLSLPWAGALLLLRRVRAPELRRLLSAAFVFVALFLAAGLYQQRWGYCLAAGLMWLTLLLLAWLFSPGEDVRAPWPGLLGGLLAALILLDGLHADRARLLLENNIANNTAIPQSWIEFNLKKRNALQWGLAAGTNHWRFAGLAPQAPLLYYYSGIPSVASYYWENTAGWRDEARLLADVSPAAATAQTLARERGLTHLVSVVRSTYPELYFYIADGIADPAYAAARTLDGRLTQPPFNGLPAWLSIDEPLSKIGQGDYVFKIPSGYAKERLQYQVFAVRPDAAAETPAP